MSGGCYTWFRWFFRRNSRQLNILRKYLAVKVWYVGCVNKTLNTDRSLYVFVKVDGFNSSERKRSFRCIL